MGNIRTFTPKREIEEEASKWLVRLDGDYAPDAQTLLELQTWINRSPAHAAELKRLAQFWDNANVLTELSIPLYHKHHRDDLGLAGRFGAYWHSLGARGLALRGVGLAMILVFAVMLINSSGMHLRGSGLTFAGNGLYETRIGEQNTITLNDGSVIELNTNSHIQVDYSKAKRSITLLQGEAHFKVSKNPNRPFEVYAGQGRVKAVGTAFLVRLQDKDQTLKVIVTEGRVSLGTVLPAPPVATAGPDEEFTTEPLYDGDDTKSAKAMTKEFGTLDAGQSILFHPLQTSALGQEVVQLEENKMEQQLAWRNGLLLFSGEPLQEVVREINRYTMMNIIISDPALADLRIGGQFKIGETQSLLKVLEANFMIDAQRIAPDTIELVNKPAAG